MNNRNKTELTSFSTRPGKETVRAISVPTEELITKYAVSGPRYTSYPTAVEFSNSFTQSDWLSCLADEFDEVNSGAGVSLYVHLPFCRSLCYFCACNKIITQDRSVTKPYLAALDREFEYYHRMFEQLKYTNLPAAGQFHWGGGTPNFLSPDEMVTVYRNAADRFGIAPDADVSIEVDPRTTTKEQVEVLAGLGFNRISLGVQDFDPAVQEAINRVQSVECTEQVISWARAAGFSSINIDLIYGLPLQQPSSFRKTINRIMEFRPERIALYGYAHVTWLTKVQRTLEREHLPSPAERISLFLEAVEQLTASGYMHIGMDHFALPSDGLSQALEAGTLNRNFMGYSTIRGSRLLGFGASSISTLGNSFAQNLKDVAGYQERMLNGDLAIERGLRRSTDDRLRGEIIELLMCQGEVSVPAIEKKWKIDFYSYFAAAGIELEALAADGLVSLNHQTICVTPLGRFFQRNIAMVFDAYLAGHRNGSKKVFSQAV